MDYNVVYGLVERLAIKPIQGSKLAVFLIRLKNQIDNLNNSNAQEDPTTTKLIDDADQGVMDFLKRLQVITLTRPILSVCTHAETPLDINKAKSAGIDSIIRLPDHISKKLSSLGTTLEKSQSDITEIKEADAEELAKKFNLVVAPSGLETSVVLTLVFLAITMLAYVTLKAKGMLGSSESYWGFLIAGLSILLGVNAVIINLIKLLRFKKNRNSIVVEAKRKYLENAQLKHSKLEQHIKNEGFQIEKREYSKAAVAQLQKIDEEERSIRQSLNT